MQTPAASSTHAREGSPSLWRSDNALLVYIALVTVVVHLILGYRYGWHRDELATLEDARHLAWGYPAYPPVTPFFGRISLELFGLSVRGFRFFAGVAQAITVVLAGLMAREMGARRGAQLVAAVAAVPFVLGGGYEMQYVAFDALAWVLTAYFVIKLLRTEDPRWWLGIGVGIGFGMLCKYTMGFFALSIVAGVLLTDARRYLKSKWLWMGVALSIVIWLPNVLWQWQHSFVSLDFLSHIHARDMREGRTANFLPQQLMMTGLRFPLALAGLWFGFFAPNGKRFRMIGWMFVVTLLLFTVAKGRWYYMGPAYPMLYAAGSVWGEQWLTTAQRGRAMTVRWAVWAALAFEFVFTTAFWLPAAPLNSRWWAITNQVQGDFREQIGWRELVQEVAKIRDSLTPEERAHLGIIGANYGEAGALNVYGPEYGLPRAISGINSFWYRGYGDPPPQTLIVVGLSRHFVDEHFESCRLAGHTWNQYGIKNEETEDHPDIWVCGPPTAGWPAFWKDFRYYG
ncbi:MAG TPA: glycosyltransferase family 39 protein [Candidatus Eisenbacteria bacterium]|nr:glycosyltransferase family 39 protein [Candidatus Eisenbacteria bacterium]